MWPTEIVASRVYDVANWFLIGGAGITVVATILVVWMGNVKETYLRTNLAVTGLAAAEANEKAEREKLARMKIEKRLAPRSLSVPQIIAIAAKLQRFKGQKFQFVSYQDDQEVLGLVRQIASALLAADWIGFKVEGFLMAELYTGVTVQYAPSKEVEFGPAARELAEALNTEGIAANAIPLPVLEKEQSDRIRIRVGKKP